MSRLLLLKCYILSHLILTIAKSIFSGAEGKMFNCYGRGCRWRQLFDSWSWSSEGMREDSLSLKTPVKVWKLQAHELWCTKLPRTKMQCTKMPCIELWCTKVLCTLLHLIPHDSSALSGCKNQAKLSFLFIRISFSLGQLNRNWIFVILCVWQFIIQASFSTKTILLKGNGEKTEVTFLIL